MKKNPFDISFGKKPIQAVDRISQRDEIISVFQQEEITQQIYLITGVRGSGKTVLMNTIANQLEQDKAWVVVRLNPDRDLLRSLGAKLSSDTECAGIFRNAKINLSLFGVGLEVTGEAAVRDVETAIERMLKSLKKAKKRLLVTIDEVTATPQIKEFASAFQIFIGQELPVFLLMTGLFDNIRSLQNEKNLTFLYRAPKLGLGPLNFGAVAGIYERVFSIPREDAVKMAGLTKGYPFAFQALGSVAWKHDLKEKEYLKEFRQLLEEYVYEKLWSELSAKDKQLAIAMAHCPEGRVRDIYQYLDAKNDEMNQYRKRLIDRGLATGEDRGYLRFALPLFDRFVLENEYIYVQNPF